MRTAAAQCARLRAHPARLFGSIPERVRIFEVGPRDGLQNEKVTGSEALEILAKAVAGIDTICSQSAAD